MPEPAKRVEWTDAYVDDLPDSAFLYIEPRGYKDAQGKTMPRTSRHFPYRDADGAIDFPRLDRAIDRIPKSAAPGLNDAKKAALVEQAQKLRAAGPEAGEEAAGEKEPGFFTRCANTLRQTPPGQLALIGVLAVVIVVALVFAVQFALTQAGVVTPGIQLPERVLSQKITRIENKAPYKEVTLTYREWLRLGHDDAGCYKNPATREYTMVTPMQCADCGKMIPTLQFSAEVLAMPPDKREEEQVRLKNEYKCPLCNKLAYPHQTL